MKVPHVPVKEALVAALAKAREARAAVKEATDRLRSYVEHKSSDTDGDTEFEAAEIALDELHGADAALANVEDRLQENGDGDAGDAGDADKPDGE